MLKEWTIKSLNNFWPRSNGSPIDVSDETQLIMEELTCIREDIAGLSKQIALLNGETPVVDQTPNIPVEEETNSTKWHRGPTERKHRKVIDLVLYGERNLKAIAREVDYSEDHAWRIINRWANGVKSTNNSVYFDWKYRQRLLVGSKVKRDYKTGVLTVI